MTRRSLTVQTWTCRPGRVGAADERRGGQAPDRDLGAARPTGRAQPRPASARRGVAGPSAADRPAGDGAPCRPAGAARRRVRRSRRRGERGDADPVPGRRSGAAPPPAAAIAGSSFTSMLNRTSGQAPAGPPARGIGSVPSIRAALTGRGAVSRAIRPGRSVTRSSVRSWNATSDPVRGRLHVGLQVGVAEPDGVLEGPPGVLREVRRPRPGARTPAASGSQGILMPRRHYGCQTCPIQVAIGCSGSLACPLPAAGLGQRDRRGRGHVQRADPADLRDVGDRVGGGRAARRSSRGPRCRAPGRRRRPAAPRAAGTAPAASSIATTRRPAGLAASAAAAGVRLPLERDQAARCRAPSCAPTGCSGEAVSPHSQIVLDAERGRGPDDRADVERLAHRVEQQRHPAWVPGARTGSAA